MAETLSKAEHLFGDSSLFEKLFGEQSVANNLRKFLDADIPKDMDGLEAYNYFQTIKHKVFNGDKKIDLSLKFNKVESGYEGLMDLAFDDDPPIYCVFSESLGKHTFTDKNSYLKFKNDYLK